MILKKFVNSLIDILQEEKECVLCTIISSNGSTPRGSGTRMIVKKDGSIKGTVGGGIVEYHTINFAKEIFKTRKTEFKEYCLSSGTAADIGMVCGGNVEIMFDYLSESSIPKLNDLLITFDKRIDFWLLIDLKMGVFNFEIIEDINLINSLDDKNTLNKTFKSSVCIKDKGIYIEPNLKCGYVYIFGGGHISQELVPLIYHLDFKPVVVEDREDFAQKSLFDNKAEIVLGDFFSLEKYINITNRDYIVIMTRGHKADYEVLKFALDSNATYIGLIGSRSKIAHTKQQLFADNYTEEDYLRIHNPIGLPIKAITPAEIAVSIAAELILHKNSDGVEI